ncbi:MAG: nuclear transport factor 2 family protein [Alphaproteobacteria bacterium]|nr:nuclear transport factor 2 family protein [Alphaproteobacteria bacterium]
MTSAQAADPVAALHAYAKAFEDLTPDRLDALCALCAEGVRFKDPFNDLTGRPAFRRVFEDMFERTRDPKFTLHAVAVSGATGYLHWGLEFIPAGSKKLWRFDGMSIVTVGADGLIESHIDHWDAAEQLYEKLPVIGAVLRLIKRQLAVD